MTRPITPKEFKDEVEGVVFSTESYPMDVKHRNLDTIMEDLLISLGYEEGIHLIRNTERWYG